METLLFWQNRGNGMAAAVELGTMPTEASVSTEHRMDLRVFETADAAATAAADWLAQVLTGAVAARGRASLALSGGRTPWRMLQALPEHMHSWAGLTVYQVDERAVPVDDERRNGHRIASLLVVPGRLTPEQFRPMPAEQLPLDVAAQHYAAALAADLGTPPIFDVVQLGLGADAHTASLIPGDPLLSVTDRAVGVSSPYQGTLRLSLTFPVLNAARARLWLVTGSDKIEALGALLRGDTSLPCGRVSADNAVIFADVAAADGLRR
jgi:6-phosphogluconolactonase